MARLKSAHMTSLDLKEYMARHKYTKRSMAAAFGMSPDAVMRWLDGSRKVPSLVSKVLLYFEKYDLNLEDLCN